MNQLLTRIRGDRGSLMTTMVFILVGSFVAAAALSFLLMRSTNDYTTAQQANVKSAIGQLASRMLGEVNTQFPEDWPNLNAADLRAETERLGDAPQLNAGAHLGFFAINPTTGVITAEIVGQATTPGGVRVIAEVKLTPSGAGIFRGLDDAGRPVWIYSNDNLDALALWEMAPNAMQYITPSGDYVPEAPANPPAVAIEFDAEAGAAVASLSSVYCRYGGTAEYQVRSAIGEAAMSDWSSWSRAVTAEFAVNEGEQLDVDARARCRSNLGNSPESSPSPTATFVRPFSVVSTAPVVTVTTAGAISWAAAEGCPTGTSQYRLQTSVNESPWSAWSQWGTSRTANVSIGEGSQLEAHVQARCANALTSGPESATGYAAAIRPFAAAPAVPQLRVSDAVTVEVLSGAACPSASDAQFRFRHRIGTSEWSSWTGWSSDRVESFTAPQGSAALIEAAQRCSSPYAASGAAITTASWNVPITSQPSAPQVAVINSPGSYSITAAGCPAGTQAVGAWSHRINAGASVDVQTPWGELRSTTVNLPEGSRLTVNVQAACRSLTTPVVGPATETRTVSHVRPIAATPTAPDVTVAAAGSATWGAAGCPSGTVVQYSWARAVNEAGFTYSAWGAQRSVADTIGEGDRVAYSVLARCANVENGVAGPSSTTDTGWRVRGVTTPGPVGNLRASFVPHHGITWDAPVCAAGTTRSYSGVARLGTQTILSATTTGQSVHLPQPQGQAVTWTVQARCVGAYAQSPLGPSSTIQVQ